MNRLAIATSFAVFLVSSSSCASKSDYVLSDQARKLTAEEITEVFTNAKEHYEALDDPGLTAISVYSSDGYFRADWEKGWFFSGSREGNWYTEGDQHCIKSTTEFDGSDLHCTSIYEKDGVYTSVHPDGSYQGTFTLTPLGEILLSDQLHEKFVGNSVHGGYSENGEAIEIWEYFHENGTIYGRDSKYGDFRAQYEIREGGCFYSDYEKSDKYDGCYYYVNESGKWYRYHRPWSDEMGREELVEGNPEGLGEE
jgi:hypothetical protein